MSYVRESHPSFNKGRDNGADRAKGLKSYEEAYAKVVEMKKVEAVNEDIVGGVKRWR